MKTLKLKSYSDPGHGWLAVKRRVLEELGILNKVTSFSYEKGATVYLEEDCDVSMFMARIKEMGISIEMISKHTNSSSPIRSYNHFKVV